ncbi:GNAT family N-acetyltransferase [Paracoccus sp. M683]|uniref:GNAT family N-acetyltransferase n=1 Tax=Paracoccus sp. M683 TaxID=2594268 RepID=UPI00163DC772|nr:GNAT family N-acetyltransferase [Paracoccus sp. M683]
MQLRPASDDERDQIARIWHSSASLPDVGPPVMPSYDQLRARVDEELAGGWVVTVAVDQGEIVGFIAMKPDDRNLAELFVSPRQLGNGVGKRLLDHAKTVMRDGFTLFTTSRNARARHFYEREGLVVERQGLHPRSGHSVTHFRWTQGQGPETA